MKGMLGRALKLLLAAALMWYVFARVQWHDRVVVRSADGVTTIAEQTGDIVGPWKVETVTFVRDGETAPVTIVPGQTEDGRQIEVVPGFLTYWRNLDVVLFALGALCYFLTALIAGTRWWWLLRVNGTDVTLVETLRFTWIGIFFNNVMPGATGGDLIKALYIMKRCPGHRVPVLVSVIVDRVLGLASLAILGAVVVLFALDRFGDLAIAIWSIMAGVALLGVVAFSKRLRSLVRLNVLLAKLPHRLSHVLKLVDQAVFFYRDHKGVIGASLLAGIVNHVVSVMSVVLIGDALDIGVPWFEYFVLIPIINIATALPIAPNGWGLGEWLYQRLFGDYCAQYVTGVANPEVVMGTRGVALSVLYRLHLTLWSLLGGILLFFEKDRVTRAEIDHEVDLEEHT